MNNSILEILNNNSLSESEKTLMLKQVAQKLIEKEKNLVNDEELVKDNEKEFEKMTDEQKENYLNSRRDFVSMTEEERQNDAIKKANQNTDEHKNRLKEINKQGLIQDHNNAIIEHMEVLSFLKNKMGENQYSKTYLQSLSGYELEAIYKDCLELMPEAMANAKTERDNAKANGVVIFEKYGFENDEAKTNIENNTKNNELEEKSKINENNNMTIDNHSIKEEPFNDENNNNDIDVKGNEDDNEIVLIEDAPNLKSKISGFFKRHMKRVIAVGMIAGILGGIGLTYKFGNNKEALLAKNINKNINTTVEELEDINNEILDSSNIDDMKYNLDLSNKTDVGDIDVTYYTNNDAKNDNNRLTPNEWHQNKIMGAVDENNNRYPARNMKDVYNLVDEGKKITSLEVGGYSPETNKDEIDGHVTNVYGEKLDTIFDNRKI